jgi:hypothetical protein
MPNWRPIYKKQFFGIPKMKKKQIPTNKETTLLTIRDFFWSEESS